MEAIKKELDQLNSYKTFIVLSSWEETPERYKQIPYRIIFDVNFDLKKAKLVAGGNISDFLNNTIKLGFLFG